MKIPIGYFKLNLLTEIKNQFINISIQIYRNY